MKRYVKASISESTPDWLKRKLVNRGWGNSFKQKFLDRYHIALDRATYEHTPSTYVNTIPIYLLSVDYGTTVYAPGVNDDDSESINGRYRKLGSIAKSKLPTMAEDIVYVTLSDENTFDKKDRYKDPRYTYRYSTRGDYAGQYMKQEYDSDTKEYKDAGWSSTGKTPANESRARDKSGYKIPSPSERLTAYYTKFPERITNKVDNVYDKLVDVKSELVNADFRSTDIDISKAYRYFSDALSDYKRMLTDVAQQDRFSKNNVSIDDYFIRSISRTAQAITSRLNDVLDILDGKDVW